MKNLFTKSIAILFLAIYAVNPLHAILHSCHDHSHSHHKHCSSTQNEKNSEIEQNAFDINTIHECPLCQNNVDKTHSLLTHLSENSSLNFTYIFHSKLSDRKLVSKSVYFVESRGPPSLI